MSWWMWLTAAAGLMIAEVFALGFFLACFGMGALAAALASALDGGGAAQLAAFSLGALAALVFVRPLFMRKSPRAPTNIDAYIGREAVALTALGPGRSTGTVRVGGEIWTARPVGAAQLPEGATVRVKAREGLVLLVGPLGADASDASQTPTHEETEHD